MCLVQTPYYDQCGHWGAQTLAIHGRCARAERSLGACWEPENIGIKTMHGKCTRCERKSQDLQSPPVTADLLGNHDLQLKSSGPIDVNKFNALVQRHKETCDRRDSATSQTVPALFAPVGEQSIHRLSATSTLSTTSTSSNLSVKGRQPILSITIPSQITFRNPVWNKDARDSGVQTPASPKKYAPLRKGSSAEDKFWQQ